MNKTVKWILIAVAALVVIAGIIFAITYFSKKASAPPPPPNQPKPPVSTDILNILGGLFSGDWFKNLFGSGFNFGLPKCDPSRPGYTTSGVYDARCTISSGDGCDPNKCSDQPGLNDCGFMDERC